jgi:hypothetical protein
VSGTASTYEAATSGTGTRGTFEFRTKEYTVKFDGIGSLIVFDSSAKDGSRINLVAIPLRIKKVRAGPGERQAAPPGG